MPTWSVEGIHGVMFEIRTKERGHNMPHVHAHYSGEDVSIALNGEVLAGGIKDKKQKEAIKWVLENARMLQERWEELH